MKKIMLQMIACMAPLISFAIEAPEYVVASTGDHTGYIKVSWQYVRNSAYYRVYRSTENNYATASQVFETSLSRMTHIDSDVSTGIAYYYWIVTVFDLNGPIEISAPSVCAMGYRGVACPTDLEATQREYGKIVLSWNAVEEAEYYIVYRGTNNDRDQAAVLINNIVSTTYTDKNIVAEQTYYYWVKAVKNLATSVFSRQSVGYAKAGNSSTTGGVPYTWIDDYKSNPAFSAAVAAAGGDYEKLAQIKGLNGRTFEECYVAGLDPTKADSQFISKIEIVNGMPVITPDPNLGTARTYITEGGSELGGEWTEIKSDADKTGKRFFRVKVELK